MRQRKPRKTFSVAWFFLGLLIAAAFVLTAAAYHHTDRSSQNRAEYYSGPVTDQVILLISLSAGQSSRQFAGFQTALADSGISSLHLQVSAAHELTVIEQIEQAMDQLARLSGRQTEQIWLLAEGGAAAILAENAGKTSSAGVIFLAPAELDLISADVWTFYPDDRPTLLLTGQAGSAADQAISLFEQQTGEDARLFHGASASGWLPAVQYRSVNGRFVLRRYPLLRSQLSMHDIRIISDLSSEMAAYYPGTAARINLISARAALSQLVFLRYYLLIGLIILSLPVLYALAVRRKTTALILSVQPGCLIRRDRWIWGLYWLPAISLCIGLVLLIDHWIHALESPWPGVLFFLPGCYGLISWTAGWISCRHQHAERLEPADLPNSALALPGKSIIYLTIIVYALIFLIFLAWRWLMFGWSSGLQISPLVMVLFFIWNIPGVWPVKHDYSGRRDQPGFLLSTWFKILRSWPYLALLVLLLVFVDGAAFIIFVILLAFLFWSDLAGRTVAMLSGRCWIGRLARALLLTLSWFHPALLPSVFY